MPDNSGWIEWSKYVIEGLKELKIRDKEQQVEIDALKSSNAKFIGTITLLSLLIIAAIVKWFMTG